MYEKIVAAFFRRQEAVALLAAEPLDGALFGGTGHRALADRRGARATRRLGRRRRHAVVVDCS